MNCKNAVVYAANDNYAKIAGISLLSLCHNNRYEDFSIFIFSDDISFENQEKLKTIAQTYKKQIQIIDIKEQLNKLKNLNVEGYENATGSKMTAFSRIFIGKLLPKEVEKVLYLDCDTLVVGNINELYKIILHNTRDGGAIALALDCLRNEYKKNIGFSKNQKYYNSGIMLIDIKAWNSNKCEKKIFESLKIRASYPLVDQDLINVALKDDILQISNKYNFITQLFLYDYSGIKKVYNLDTTYWMSEKEFISAKEDACIYHFCGNTFIRPWYANSKHPKKKLYDFYYNLSPWKDESQPKQQWKLPYLIQYVLYKSFPKNFSVLIGNILQRIFIKITYKI